MHVNNSNIETLTHTQHVCLFVFIFYFLFRSNSRRQNRDNCVFYLVLLYAVLVITDENSNGRKNILTIVTVLL